MSFLYFEGTKDFIAATPALITTFVASGSTVAGRLLSWTTGDMTVGHPASTAGSGSTKVAGLCLATVSSGDPCPVLVWGYAKNVAATAIFTCGDALVCTGSGYIGTSGSVKPVTGSSSNAYWCGRYVSGSSTSAIVFINCLGP